MEAKDKLTIKDAANYLEKQGIGTDTNITVNLTASLMVGFTNDHLLHLMPSDERKRLDDKYNLGWGIFDGKRVLIMDSIIDDIIRQSQPKD